MPIIIHKIEKWRKNGKICKKKKKRAIFWVLQHIINIDVFRPAYLIWYYLERRVKRVLEEFIENVRAQLNDLIAANASYDRIYKVSTELDLLINAYYSQKKLTA